MGRNRCVVVVAAVVALLGASPLATAAQADSTVPDAPAQPEVQPGDGNIVVTFAAPPDGGSAITGYTASCTSSDGGASGSADGDDSPITVPALDNGKRYTCTVVAHNASGAGAASPASDSIIAGTPFFAPGSMHSAWPGNGEIFVGEENATSPIGTLDSYTATCTSNDGGAPGSATTHFQQFATVTGLTNDKTYTCTEFATNASGAGPVAGPTAPVVPSAIGTFTEPPAPTVATDDSDHIIASFDPVATDNGDAILSYEVVCAPVGGGLVVTGSDVASPITLFGLAGVTYTCVLAYLVPQATILFGTVASEPVTMADVPGAPDKPTAVAEDGALDVRFVAPATNGSAVTGYAADCVSSDGGVEGLASTSDPNATDVDVTGLDNGTHYTCTVVATSTVGTSASSPASDNIVAGSPIVSASLLVWSGDGKILVAPSDDSALDNGSPIVEWYAQCDSSDGGASGSGSSDANAVTVTGLTNDKTYTCVEWARNGNGAGVTTTASNPIIPGPNAVPDAPAQPIVSHGNGSIMVGFDPPDPGTSPIIRYDVSCLSSNGGISATGHAAVPPVNVKGLTLGKTYTCSVVAVNASGSGFPSVPSDPIVAAAVSDAPTINDVSAADRGVTVGFDAPVSDGGSAITGYSVSCASNDGGASAFAESANTTITVSGLDNGKHYTCNVVAHNVAGDSAPATTDAVVAGAPQTPEQPFDVPAGDGTMAIFILPINDNGSAITSITVSCVSSDGGAPGTLNIAYTTGTVLVTGLTNGKTYSCSEYATNARGDSLASAADDTQLPDPPGPIPDPVTGTTAAPSDGAVNIAFTPGVDPDADYVAECLDQATGGIAIAANAASPITVTGLTNGRAYKCRVLALNAYGLQTAGDLSNTVIPGTPVTPAQPTLDVSGTTINVSFSPPNDNGSAITGYTASCTSNDGGLPGSATDTASPLHVTGLSKAKTYTCNVYATNANGNGDPSVDSNPILVPATEPDAPAAPTVVPGNGKITVSFVAPDDGGSPITHYLAACTSSDGGTFSMQLGDSSPLDVLDLDNGYTYTCVVHAQNNVGGGPNSSPSTAVTPLAEPQRPDQPSISEVDGSINVAFTPPNDDGDPIVQYTAACTSSDGGTPDLEHGPASPITVGPLTPGKTYTCTIVAASNSGSSEPSPASNPLTLSNGSAPLNTRRPHITGSLIAQRTLSAGTGSWSSRTSVSYTYTWQRCNAAGHNCTNITGAHSRSYVLKKADVDMRMRVVVKATNLGGHATKTSTVSNVVRWIPISIKGELYFDGARVLRSDGFSVGAATHGNKTWIAYNNGDVHGPHYGPRDGTLVGLPLNKPIIGIVATPSGNGYWMYASDGGVFGFGDAHFYGSTGGRWLYAPIVAMTATPDGKGYWLFAQDGGVFTFGSARFYGSTGGQAFAHPVVAMLSSPSGRGYWLVTSDGRAQRFGDAPNIGDVTRFHRNDIVGLVSLGAGYRFVTSNLQLLAPST